MPTRHLTDAQRQGFAHFDGEPSTDQLARYFHLDQTDRDLIGALRGDHNRLGFAVMLTSVRFLGAFPISAAEIPASVLAIVIEQLDLEPTTGVHAYFQGSRRIRQLLEERVPPFGKGQGVVGQYQQTHPINIALIRENWPDHQRRGGGGERTARSLGGTRWQISSLLQPAQSDVSVKWERSRPEY